MCLLSERVTSKLVNNIVTILCGVTSKWFEIATLLGIPVNNLNAIKEECESKTEACLREVIKVHVKSSFVHISSLLWQHFPCA